MTRTRLCIDIIPRDFYHPDQIGSYEWDHVIGGTQ